LDADLHMAQLMPLPLSISCSSKSRLVLPSWFYLSGDDSPGYFGTKSKRTEKWLCMCVCVVLLLYCLVLLLFVSSSKLGRVSLM